MPSEMHIIVGTHHRRTAASCGCKCAGVTQLVECNLAKVDVAGSNPVSRSNSSPGFPPPVRFATDNKPLRKYNFSLGSVLVDSEGSDDEMLASTCLLWTCVGIGFV